MVAYLAQVDLLPINWPVHCLEFSLIDLTDLPPAIDPSGA